MPGQLRCSRLEAALRGTTLLVGACLDDGVRYETGSAYLFDRDHHGFNQWGQVIKLTGDAGVVGNQPELQFGFAVALTDDTAVVGAPQIPYYGGIGSAYAFHVGTAVNQPPAADAGLDVAVSVADNCSATVQLNGSRSTDPDGGPLTYSWSGPFGTVAGPNPLVTLPLGIHTLTLIVEDSQGASATDTVQIAVTDATPPVAACPTALEVAADENCGAFVPDLSPQVAASVNCTTAADLRFTQSPASESRVGLGTHAIQVLITDFSGNQATCATTFTVLDKTPPAIFCPAGLVVATDPGQCTAAVDYQDGVSATDNCPGVILVCDPPSGSAFPKGTTTVACVARDQAGNISARQFTITVEDREAPIAACIATTNPSGSNTPPAGKSSKAGENPDGFSQLQASDNCDQTPAIYIQDSQGSFIAGPFANEDRVKIVQAPGSTPNFKPMAGVIVAHIQLQGDARVYAVDASGNSSRPKPCQVPPRK